MSHLVCRNGVDLLMDYLEGEVSPELRDSIDAHVAGCAKCVAFVASYQATPRVVREATNVIPPADLGDSLLEFLRQRR